MGKSRILAQDHFNDIMLNILGIVLTVLGVRVAWWIDPAGAILIALLILRSWSTTAMDYVQLIIGKTADPGFLSKITYMAMNHSEVIKQVDTCRAYHCGGGLFVEVDVVVDPECSLKIAHDVGETLQIAIEAVDGVQRAFVHLDYESEHKPAIEHKY
jgi:divalent metal cation (Fe/Co/Zn/Cd) transporter